MKKLWTITILVSLLILVCGVAVVLWPRTVPLEQCSEVYRHYVGRPDLKVGFVKDYRIDDTTVADVTTLTAKDSIGWEALLREMNIPEMLIELARKNAQKGRLGLAFYNCPKNTPEKSCAIDVPNTDLVFYIYREKTLYFFSIVSKAQEYAIQEHKIKETFSSIKKQDQYISMIQ